MEGSIGGDEMKIKVWVLMPIYNVAPYLRDSLGSVLSQTLREFEIICVDDGSTDESLSILEEYARMDSRVRVFKTNHQGAGAARNIALKEAVGEYLSILDADDIFDKIMLEKAVSRADTTHAEVVIFRHERLDHGKGKRYLLSHMSSPEKFPIKDVFSSDELRSLPKFNWFMSVYGWTWDKLFRRSYVLGLGLTFQEIPAFNDMFYTYSAVAEAKRISYLPDVLICRRVNRPGAITGKVGKYWMCVIEALLKTRFRLEDRSLHSQIPDFTAYALHMILFTVRQLSGETRKQAVNSISGLGRGLLRIRLDDLSIPYVGNEVEEWKQIVSGGSAHQTPVSCATKRTLDLNPFQRMVECYHDEGLKYTLKRLLVLGRRH